MSSGLSFMFCTSTSISMNFWLLNNSVLRFVHFLYITRAPANFMGGQKTHKKATRSVRRHPPRKPHAVRCVDGDDEDLQAALEQSRVQFEHEQAWRMDLELTNMLKMAKERLPQCILDKIADLHENLAINRYRLAQANPPPGADAPNKLQRRKRVLAKLWDALDAADKMIVLENSSLH